MNFVILTLTTAILLEGILCVYLNGEKNTFKPIVAQHLGQDGLGRYTYGYITPTSTKSESKGVDGIIRGGYSYLDPKGNIQTVHYEADPVHGFLVAASNLPQDVASVAYAKQRHLQKFDAIRTEHAAIALSKLTPVVNSLDHTNAAPLVTIPIGNLPRDTPVVAFAKQKHHEKYEAIKAEHAALALAKQNPQELVSLSNSVKELPAVAQARAQHLAAFEAVKARDVALKAAKVLTEENLLKVNTQSYIPIALSDTSNYYSYGYVHPINSQGASHANAVQGYSFLDTNGVLKTINYLHI